MFKVQAVAGEAPGACALSTPSLQLWTLGRACWRHACRALPTLPRAPAAAGWPSTLFFVFWVTVGKWIILVGAGPPGHRAGRGLLGAPPRPALLCCWVLSILRLTHAIPPADPVSGHHAGRL